MSTRLLLLIFFLTSVSLSAQEKMRVERSNALEWGQPVRNIFVDADNRKWVSNSAGLFIVYDTDIAEPVKLAAGEQSLYQFPGGNADIRWTQSQLTSAIGDILDRSNFVSAALYDAGRKELWIGTSQTGLFRLRTEPSLQLVQQLTTGDSKLRSDQVNALHLDGRGRLWVGTNDGVMVGKDGRWDLLEKNLVIEAIASYESEVWLMGDGLLGPVDRRDIWSPISIPNRKTEGSMRDITFDDKGNLWIASEVITRYDPAANEFTVYGPAQEYTSQFANFLIPDLEGTIWVGTRDKGLYRIGRASGLLVDLQITQPASCSGDANDAALRVVVAGGQPPYTYTWTNGLTGERPRNLTPGAYQVTVADSKGASKAAQVEIADPRMTVTAQVEQPAAPGGSATGAALVTVAGGSPDYRFQWDNGETTRRASQLTPGAHAITVTDAAGCRTTATVTITEAAAALAVEVELANPVQCKGEQNAALRAIVAGGQPPYAYQWSLTSINKNEIVGLGAGDYTVTVTDARDQQVVASLSVTDPPTLTATGKVVQPAGTGAADGQATVNVTGGEPTYTFRWDNGAAEQLVTGLAPGYHTVTVTDQRGCEATSTFNVPEDILPLDVTLQLVSDIGCNGGFEASLQAEVAGGKSPYTYQWNDATLKGPLAAGLAAGSYQLTVVDATGQSQSSEITIDEPEALQATATAMTAAGTGAADGQATVTVRGGTPGYSYRWDNDEKDANAKLLAAGAHSVTVTDANGCTTNASVEITEDILPLQVNLTQTATIDCNGANGAAIQAQVGGGKGPFQYQWNNSGISGEQAAGLNAGEYALTVTDATGQSQSANLRISQPDALQATATGQSPASTGASDGQAAAQASGGTAPYSFRWDNGETNAKATALAPGAHSVTITDANGCTTNASVEITEDILPLQVNLTQTATIDCNGANGAAIQAQVGGGKGPFQYQWNNPGISGEQAAGLNAGEYALTVTDATGQSQSANLRISQPDALQATATGQSPASTGASDGQAAAQASGGTAPYSFRWDNGETNAKATALAPGAHSVTITDANGCNTNASVEITEDILPLQVNLTQTATIDCNGANGAAIQAQVGGGKGPFQYQWNNSGISGEQATGLNAGEYALTVTDATGQSQSANLRISQPDALQATATGQSPASTGASDGQAAAQASGGTAPYSFRWDNGETNAKATALAPGAHTVTITDANGCNTNASVEITEDILPLQVNLTQTATIDCNGANGAAIQAQVGGGKGPFQYQWNNSGISGEQATGLNAGEYALTVTDATGQSQSANLRISQPDALQATATVEAPANTDASDGQALVRPAGGTAPYTFRWDNGETDAKATALAPGSHSVTVTDANGCTTNASVEITEDILPLQVNLTQTATIDCNGANGAAIQAQVGGGKGPFQYQWNNSGISGEQATGLNAGEYALTVTDATGQSQSANLRISQPDALQATATVEAPANTDASDGQALVRPAGGTAPYTFRWDNGETDAKATALAPGSHSVTVTDANGCTTNASVEITEDILPLQVNLTQTATIDCNGANGAAIQAQVGGGKGPFQYQWNNPGISGEQAAGLNAGEYALTVTDATGQSQSANLRISQPDALQATATVEAPANTDASDGQALVRPAGGTAPYSFRWDNGETDAKATALAPGAHTVTVTDANGCAATAAVEITEDILPLQVRLSQTGSIKCHGQGAAGLRAEVSGGKKPFQFKWSDAGLDSELAGEVQAGDYSVTITDASGQTQSAAITVTEPAPLTITIEDNRPASTDETADGQARLKVAGGTGRYTYAWDNGETNPEATGLAIGSHGVTVTDENGCTAAVAFETAQKTIPELTAGRLRSGMTIQMQKLQFEADSTRIMEQAQPIIDEVYQFLKDNPSIVVEIGGHTNNLPPAEYCDWLSTERAKAVAEYLVIKGIDPNRVAYKGYGKREPLFSNQTADGRRRNQRVEIKILRL